MHGFRGQTLVQSYPGKSPIGRAANICSRCGGQLLFQSYPGKRPLERLAGCADAWVWGPVTGSVLARKESPQPGNKYMCPGPGPTAGCSGFLTAAARCVPGPVRIRASPSGSGSVWPGLRVPPPGRNRSRPRTDSWLPLVSTPLVLLRAWLGLVPCVYGGL